MREASLGLLMGYLGPIVDAIVGSVGRCPPAMRLAFKRLHRRVEERFPQDEHKVGRALPVGRWGDWDVACLMPHFAGLSPGLPAEVLSGTRAGRREGREAGSPDGLTPDPCGWSQYRDTQVSPVLSPHSGKGLGPGAGTFSGPQVWMGLGEPLSLSL